MPLLLLSIDLLVLQAAREVSYSARTFTPITSAASHILGRPGPGEPSGFLVAPGRAEGVARPALRVMLLRSARKQQSPAPSASRAPPSRHLRLR